MSAEFDELADQLRKAGDVEQRRDAANRLRDLGFARRTSLEKRGTLAHPAERRLTAHELEALHAALDDDDRSVRRNAIIIAGDLGDATSVPILQRHCESHDRDIALAAIDSLGDIGGTESMSTLTDLARDCEEDAEIRLAALTQLEELAAKRITSGPDRRFDPHADRHTADDEVDDAAEAKAALIEALHSIESESAADDLLRLKAADVRAYLESGVA